MMRWMLAGLIAAQSGAALAQAPACIPPRQIATPRPDGPSFEQPRRILPIGGYTLALTWSPQICREDGRDVDEAFRCRGSRGKRAGFGFTLHGLWPDGRGPAWPQYCRSAAILPLPVLATNLCATPSAQLIQHEWAKHGTCMATRPNDYFDRARRLYGQVRYPDMAALARRPMTLHGFARAFVAANPGITPAMLKVTTTREGWLDEIWLCLDTKFRRQACPPHQRMPRRDAPLRIWRG